MKKVTILLGLILTCFSIFFYKNYVFGTVKNYNNTKVEALLDKINLDNIDNLMIVAHPDDEMIWGGAELIQNNYLVVCVTCGTDRVRVNEFYKVMSELEHPYLMLNYPDLVNGKMDKWENGTYYRVFKDVLTIINYKKWNKIVTHNPEGEYGHIHHIMTSKIVTSNSNKDKLYYFEKYYTKEELSNLYYELPNIGNDLLNKKEKILKLYVTQKRVVDVYHHMLEHEEIIPYKDWS